MRSHGANWKPLKRDSAHPGAGFIVHHSNGINQYKHGLSRRYLLLDDEGGGYEAAGRNAFEVPFDEALHGSKSPEGVGRDARNAVMTCLRQSQRAALRAAGIEVLRIRIVPKTGWYSAHSDST